MSDADTLKETKLRAWRLAEGLTLEEVAGLTGLSVGMVSKVERSKARLAPLTKVTVARRLGVPLRTERGPPEKSGGCWRSFPHSPPKADESVSRRS